MKKWLLILCFMGLVVLSLGIFSILIVLEIVTVDNETLERIGEEVETLTKKINLTD